MKFHAEYNNFQPNPASEDPFGAGQDHENVDHKMLQISAHEKPLNLSNPKPAYPKTHLLVELFEPS